MNEKQRKILITSGVIAFLMLLFPPFQLNNGYNMGYHFILKPPGISTVNSSLLVTQWLGVIIIAVIAYIVTGGKNNYAEEREKLGYINEDSKQNNSSPLKQRNETNVFMEFWVGKKPLWVAYWLVAVSGGWLVVVVGSAIGIKPPAIQIIFIVYMIWSAVSVWRCALNTDWKYWGYLARASIVFGVLSFLINISKA